MYLRHAIRVSKPIPRLYGLSTPIFTLAPTSPLRLRLHFRLPLTVTGRSITRLFGPGTAGAFIRGHILQPINVRPARRGMIPPTLVLVHRVRLKTVLPGRAWISVQPVPILI